MKILYVIDQEVEKGSTAGIIHKVKGQVSRWEDCDAEVKILSMYSFKFYNAACKLIDDSKSFKLSSHGRYYTLFRMFYSTIKLNFHLNKYKYDLIYMRQRPLMPFSKSINKNNNVVIEINTFDFKEYKVISKLMDFYNSFTRNYFYKYALGFVGVTQELASSYSDEFGKKSIAIGNGINVKNYELCIPKNQRPKVVFVGSPGFKWHGLDKVSKLSELLPEFDFEIIGIKGENSENLFFHGYLDLEEVKKIVSNSDVGLCTLSLYINGLTEATPLKSRQYMAHGLPIIYAYKDTDLIGDEEFVLNIPNSENNIFEKLEEIKTFILKVYGNKSMRQKTRLFAEKNLDVGVKELKRTSFLKSLIKLPKK